uniref:BTB domain-containing protein n=1 Tax=Acrobeloides nanus TaxID=290746 RepID=A0A914CFP1_9BILA
MASFSQGIKSEKPKWNGFKEPGMKGRLRKLLFKEALADVEFILTKDTTEPVKVFAHSLFLSMASDVFMTMFYDERFKKITWDESLQRHHINIEDIDPNTFKQLIRFLYTDHIDMDADSALAMLYTAQKYNIATLKKKCILELETALEHKKNNPSYVFDIVMVASGYDLTKLLDASLLVLVKHEEYINHSSFMALDKDVMSLVIQFLWKFAKDPALVFKRMVEFAEKKLLELGKPAADEPALREYLKNAISNLNPEVFKMLQFFDQKFFFAYAGLLTDEQQKNILNNLTSDIQHHSHKNHRHLSNMDGGFANSYVFGHSSGLPSHGSPVYGYRSFMISDYSDSDSNDDPRLATRRNGRNRGFY